MINHHFKSFIVTNFKDYNLCLIVDMTHICLSHNYYELMHDFPYLYQRRQWSWPIKQTNYYLRYHWVYHFFKMYWNLSEFNKKKTLTSLTFEILSRYFLQGAIEPTRKIPLLSINHFLYVGEASELHPPRCTAAGWWVYSELWVTTGIKCIS